MGRMSILIRLILFALLCSLYACGAGVSTTPGSGPEGIDADSVASLAAKRARAGDLGGAMLLYRGVLDETPEHVPSLRGMLEVAAGTSDPTTARHYYERLDGAGALEPDDVRVLARAQTQAGTTDAAIATLEQGMARFPTNADLAADLGLRLVDAGRAKEAREALEAAVAGGADDRRAYRTLADILFEAGDYDAALPVLESFARRYPGDYAVEMRIAYVYYERDDCDAAVPHYQAAVRARASGIDARVGLGRCYEELGRNDDAIRTYDKALRQRGIVREMEPVILAQTNLLNEKGRYDRALAVLEQASSAFSLTPALHCAMGMALAGEGRYDDAIASFQQALADRTYSDFARAQIQRIEQLRKMHR
jgi:tetratricopeptide (TPR) repeat protein